MRGQYDASFGKYEVNIVGEERIPSASDSPLFIPKFDESGLRLLAAECMDRIDRKFDCPLLITGYPGMGKSTVAQKIARHITPKFSLDHLHFTLKDMMADVSNLPYAEPKKKIYPLTIFDESGTGLFSQEWQDPRQKKVVKTFQVNRKKGLISIFILPGFDDLNSRLREKRVYWWCHIAQDTRVAIVRRNRENQFGTSAFWEAKFAFEFNPLSDERWDEYERRKSAFIDHYLKDEEDLTPYDKKDCDRLRVLIYTLHKEGYSLQRIGEIINLSKNTMTKYNELGEQLCKV